MGSSPTESAMDLKQKEALINTLVGTISALVRDMVAHEAAAEAGNNEAVKEMDQRVFETKRALKRTLEILLL